MLESMFEENKKAPAETLILSSRGPGYQAIFTYALVSGGLLWWALSLPMAITALILYAIVSFFIVLVGYEIRSLSNNKTIKLRLDNKGIEILEERRFIPWSRIERFEFEDRNIYNNTQEVDLVLYNSDGKVATIDFEKLDIGSGKLNYLLKIYKDRELAPIIFNHHLKKNIMNHNAKSIRPFIGAKDFDISRSFYRDLGFEETTLGPDMSVFKSGNHAFYLQKYYNKDWVNNTMIFMEIDDTARFYDELKALGLQEKYKNVKLTPIRNEDWGRECFLHDPLGILWHFGEFFN